MSQESIRVLLIEDNPGDAKLIRQMLSASPLSSFNVRHVRSLQAGLEVLKTQSIDVLLLDLGLPGTSGVETVSRASKAAPSVPIIVLSGTDVPKVILESIKSGVRDYFVKSRIEPERLIEAIERVCGS